MATSVEHSGWKKTAGQNYLSAYVMGKEAFRLTAGTAGTYGSYGLYQVGTGKPTSAYEALAYMVDGYNVNLATGYASAFTRKYALDIEADTGSTDLTGNVNVGAIQGRVVAGTTQSNCGISGVVGILDVGTVNLQGSHNGVCGVLDFYGNCTLGTGATCYGAGLVSVVWNEANTTLGASAVLSGVDIIENGAVYAYGTGSRNPAVNIRGNWKEALYAAITASGTTAKDLMSLVVTDSSTCSTGYNRGLYIDWNSTGAKTGDAEINGIGIDIDRTANCVYSYGLSIYFSQTGNPTGYNSAISVYMDNMGTAATNLMCADFQLGQSSVISGGSRFGFIRCRDQGTQKPNAVILCEGANAATNLLDCDANAGNGFVNAGGAGTCTITGGWVKLAIDVNGTTYYIPAGVTLSNS